MRGNDPVSLLKAVKNATEIAGTKAAHRRDAVALARFLAWIDRLDSLGSGQGERGIPPIVELAELIQVKAAQLVE